MEMDPKMMEKAFEAAQKGQAGALNLTPEETERFKKAFDDPEFCKLMSEYVSDLQNPEYRAETESYISELEGENKVPAGKELVRPDPGFVAKTYKVAPGDGGKGDKVFLNVVSSEKITKPTSTTSDKGQSWSLPYSVGPPHMESDKSGTSAAAFDICFHPEALRLAQANRRFRDMLVKTGIDGVQQAYRAQKQDVTLSEDFHVLKGVLYKQGQVPTMLIDKAARDEKWNNGAAPAEPEPAPAPAAPAVSAAPAPAKGISANKPAKHSTTVKQGTREPVIKKGFLGGDKPRAAIYPEGSSEGAPGVPPPRPLITELKEPRSAPPAAAVSPPAPPEAPVAEEVADMKERRTIRRAAPAGTPDEPDAASGGGDKAPVFRLKERGIISMGDFEGVNKATGMVVESNRPAELVYTIELPLVTKPSKVQLDVAERSLKLCYADIYELSIRFPYDVLDKKGTAKYDKTAKTLTVTVPVKPAERKPLERPGAPSAVAEVAVDSEPAAGEGGPPATSGMRPSPTKKDAHKRWVSEAERAAAVAAEGEAAPSSLSEEIARKAKEALERHSAEAAAAPKQTPKPKPVEPNPKVQSETAAPVLESFIASPVFVGQKQGYCFKLGDSGQGYYPDVPLHKRSRPAPAPTPTAAPAAALPAATPVVAESKFEPFVFEYRQTKEAVAVLVQVPKIKGDSVNIKFSSSGCDIAFAAIDASGDLKFHSMAMTCTSALNEESCKYDVASLNMVVVLAKREPVYWREDRLVDPEDLTEFEAGAKQLLAQPITILRLSPGSAELQKVCLEAVEKAPRVQTSSSDSPSRPRSSATTSSQAAGAVSAKPSPSSSSSAAGSSSSPLPTAGNKMKFTVGALLDLD